jgi:transposase InsO family protein
VRARIIALRQTLVADGADAGLETIAWHLAREGLQVPSTSTIQRILRAAGLVVPQPKKRPKSSYLRFQAELPNGCWQADITYWFLVDGTRVEILDFLDDHSRLLLTIQAKTLWTSADVVTVMGTLIRTYGAPAATLTDNGMVFTARFTTRPGAKNGFEKLLAAHQIQQRNGAPGHPQTQGKIERFHQTLKRWLTARPAPTTITELQAMLDSFQTWYNTDRPHRALNRRTPIQAYTALSKATPNTTHETEYRTRTDRVDNNGKVTVRYTSKIRVKSGKVCIGSSCFPSCGGDVGRCTCCKSMCREEDRQSTPMWDMCKHARQKRENNCWSHPVAMQELWCFDHAVPARYYCQSPVHDVAGLAALSDATA